MEALKTWYFLDTGSNSPWFNMAVDEVLFLGYQQKLPRLNLKYPVFRIYQWDKDSFSLGYTQTPDKEFENVFLNSNKYVRRISGGGIIFHGDDLTYSMILKEGDLGEFKNIKESYRYLCSFLIGFYRDLGLDAYFCCDRENKNNLGEFSSFCFSKNEFYDIAVSGKKIGGNAQRRMRRYILQHGVIPFSMGRKEVEKVLLNIPNFNNFICLKDLLGGMHIDDIKNKLTTSFKNTFCVNLEKFDFRLIEDFVKEIIEIKYRTNDWNRLRIDNYNLSKVKCQ